MTGRRGWRLLALLALGGATLGRAASTAPEVEVKAAFIFHFAQFVDWPPAAFDGPEAPFVIGVFGSRPIDEALGAMVRGERFAGHPVEVRRLRRPGDAASCQIIYVSADGEDLFRPARLRGDPVLTVGESEEFLAAGGMIEFFTENNHVRLRINLPAARASALQISSKLLRVAQVLPAP